MNLNRIALVRHDTPMRVLRAAAAGFALVALVGAAPPVRAQDDLPTRVGRIADLAGEVFHAPEDRASDWDAIGLNFPITSGDNLWVAQGGRAELDVGAGQVRLGPETNLHVARLDARAVAIFLAQGQLSLRLRVLDPGEVARIDTPNTQVVVTRPGLYRVEVSPERSRTVLVVREGEATLPSSGGMQQVLPGQTAVAEGLDATRVDVHNGLATDGFDTWVAERDRRYERNRSSPYVSRQMIGSVDLDDHGSWENNATYGAVWYPTQVDAGWAPYRSGTWTWVSPWGWTWVDTAPWGFAPFHYGRWVFVSGRWGWCPGRFVARPVWAPAMVGWVGGANWGVSVSWGAPVYGWVPLAWGEPFRPWWNSCSSRCWNGFNQPYAARVDEYVRRAPPASFINASRPGGITAVSGTTLGGGRPVYRNLVPVSAAEVASAPNLARSPSVGRIADAQPAVKPRVGQAPAPASLTYGRSGPGSSVPLRNGSAAAPEQGRQAKPSGAEAARESRPPSAYTAPVQRESLQTYAPSRGNAVKPSAGQDAVPPPVRHAAPQAPTYAPAAAPPQAPSRPRQATPVAGAPAASPAPVRVAPLPQPAGASGATYQRAAPGAPAAPAVAPQAVGQAPSSQAPARQHETSKPARDSAKPAHDKGPGGDGHGGGRGNAVEQPGGVPR